MKDSSKKLLKGVAITALTAGTIYGINRLVFWASTMKDILFSKEKSYYSWRFGNIYYTKKGEGKPVLLIHDLEPWGSDYEWQAIVDHLAEDHTVYTIDLPGCGRSSKEKMVYTNYVYVQAINDFVKHVIKAKTDIITSGAASSIAVVACHSEPSLYGKFIFINPESLEHMAAVSGSCQKFMSYFIQLPLIGTLAYVAATSRMRIKRKVEQDYFYDSANIQPDAVAAFYESAHLGGFSTRFSYASQIGRFVRMNVIFALKKIDHSMYIIGGSDVKNVERVMDGYTHYNPAIETTYIDHAKLMPHMEMPEETAEICKLYLND